MHNYYKANFLQGPTSRTPKLYIYHLYLLFVKMIFYASFASTHTQCLKNERKINTVLNQNRTDIGVLNTENIPLNFNISVIFTKGM